LQLNKQELDLQYLIDDFEQVSRVGITFVNFERLHVVKRCTKFQPNPTIRGEAYMFYRANL